MTTQDAKQPEDCAYHLDHAGETCPGCGEPVDPYGNTAYDFKYCSFPDCGCDGARLCGASEGASEFSLDSNVENMWGGNKPEQVRARKILVGTLMSEAMVAKFMKDGGK